MSAAEEAVTSSDATAIASSSSDVVTQIQLESLDDTVSIPLLVGMVVAKQHC